MLSYEPKNSDIPYIGKPRTKWPFADLLAGENVLIYPNEKISAKNICQAAYNFGAKRKWSMRTGIETRSECDHSTGEEIEIIGVRVWRVK